MSDVNLSYYIPPYLCDSDGDLFQTDSPLQPNSMPCQCFLQSYFWTLDLRMTNIPHHTTPLLYCTLLCSTVLYLNYTILSKLTKH